MLGKDEQAAIDFLEEHYDRWDLELKILGEYSQCSNTGWVRERGDASRTAKFFNIRQDLREACITRNAEICAYHVGEIPFGNINPLAYGRGTYFDPHYDTEIPCYGIDLDDDAWKDPNP